MNTTTMTFLDDMTEEEGKVYVPLSKAAVVSLFLAALSLTVVWFPLMLVVPVLGFLMGLYGWRSIYRYPEELTGRVPAALGTVLCGALFVGGLAAHSVAYATEVPDGYLRISFADLQPVPRRPDLPVSPEALKFNGQRIFVKGYVYPDGQQSNIKRFVLVPDMGTCCFGGQPKLTDMIEVTLEDPLRTEFALRKRRLGGILKVDTALKPVNGLGGVYFQLKADYLR